MLKAEKLLDILASMLGLVLIAGVFLNFINAILRYGFGDSLIWAEEILIFGLILIVMAGLIVISARSENLRIDIFIQIMPPKVGRMVMIATGFVICAVFAYLAWQSYSVVSLMHRLGQTSVAARIPIWIPHSFLFVSFVLAALAALYRTLLDIKALRDGHDPEQGSLHVAGAEGEVQ